VVVDHVQQQLEAGIVQRARQQPELAQVGAGEKTVVRRKKTDRVVAPVIAEPHLDQAPLVDVRVHRQQLERGRAQIGQIRHHGRLGQAAKTAAQRLRHLRVAARVAAGVQFVDHAAPPRPARPGLRHAAGVVHHHALRQVTGTVAGVEGQIATRVAHPVAVQRVVPTQRAVQQPRVGVDQQLVVVETVAALGVIGPVHAVAVQLAGPQVRQVAVPDLIGVLRQRQAGDLAAPGGVEQTKLDFLGVQREQGEIDAAPVPVRAERIRLTRPQARRAGA
jgi:hypothetical protein